MEGVRHSPARIRAVRALAVALALLALFGTLPAIWQVASAIGSHEELFVRRWICLSVLVGLVQGAYVIYLVQLPDWSSVWLVSLAMLGMTALYAMLSAVSMLASPENGIMIALELTTGRGGRGAGGWSLIMASVTGLFAYFSGRLSVRWYRIERVGRSGACTST